jgi:hypothetical protein
MKTLKQAARGARDHHDLMVASQAVMGRRFEIISDAMRDPSTADLAELNLMVAEKVQAGALSAVAAAQGTAKVMADASGAAMREGALAGEAMRRIATARDPMSAFAAQASYAAAFWGRNLQTASRLTEGLLRAQSEAMAPINRAASANARRLKR